MSDVRTVPVLVRFTLAIATSRVNRRHVSAPTLALRDPAIHIVTLRLTGLSRMLRDAASLRVLAGFWPP
jgi:hypothetical protein